MAKKHGKMLLSPELLELKHSLLMLTPGIAGTDVLRLKIPGIEMVVLNTSETISDLLDQRSAIYSDKVRAFMLHVHNTSLRC